MQGGFAAEASSLADAAGKFEHQLHSPSESWPASSAAKTSQEDAPQGPTDQADANTVLAKDVFVEQQVSSCLHTRHATST